MFPPALILQTPQAALSPKDFQAKCAEFSKAKDWPGLESLARTQIAANPKDASAQAALGYALLAQNRPGEGKVACEASLALDSKRTDALYYLGLDAARESNTKAVMEVARRIGARDQDSESRFLLVPAIQQSAIPPLEIPVAPGRIRFKNQRLERLLEAQGRPGAPMAVALVVDPQGVPISAHALMAPSSQAAMCLESDAMRWRVESILVDGKPSSAKFVAVVHLGGSPR